MSVLLALDPSFAAYGWAVLELGTAPRLIAAGVIETKPTPKNKRTGSACEDDARRVRFLRRELGRLFDAHRPVVVAAEAASGSKSAIGAKALGIAQAITACVVDEHMHDGQAIYVSALEAGDALGLERTQRTTRPKGTPKPKGEIDRARKARKAAIARAVIARLGEHAWRHALELGSDELASDARWEGAHDAAAVALAAWERPEVAAVRALVADAWSGEA